MVDRDEHILQPVALLQVVVDVAGHRVGESALIGELDEVGDPLGVTMHEVLLKLDDDIVRAEPFDIIVDEPFGLFELSGIDELR